MLLAYLHRYLKEFRKTLFFFLHKHLRGIQNNPAFFFFSGTRYNRRGVDEHGNVANYVETEQVGLLTSILTSALPKCRNLGAPGVGPDPHAYIAHFENSV